MLGSVLESLGIFNQQLELLLWQHNSSRSSLWHYLAMQLQEAAAPLHRRAPACSNSMAPCHAHPVPWAAAGPAAVYPASPQLQCRLLPLLLRRPAGGSPAPSQHFELRHIGVGTASGWSSGTSDQQRLKVLKQCRVWLQKPHTITQVADEAARTNPADHARVLVKVHVPLGCTSHRNDVRPIAHACLARLHCHFVYLGQTARV